MKTQLSLVLAFLFAMLVIANAETTLGATQNGGIKAEQVRIERDSHGQRWLIRTWKNQLGQTVEHQRPATTEEAVSMEQEGLAPPKADDAKPVVTQSETSTVEEKATENPKIVVQDATKMLEPTPLPNAPRQFSGAEVRLMVRNTVRKTVTPFIMKVAALEASLVDMKNELKAKSDAEQALADSNREVIESNRQVIASMNENTAMINQKIAKDRVRDRNLGLFILAVAMTIMAAFLIMTIMVRGSFRHDVDELKLQHLLFMLRDSMATAIATKRPEQPTEDTGTPTAEPPASAEEIVPATAEEIETENAIMSSPELVTEPKPIAEVVETTPTESEKPTFYIVQLTAAITPAPTTTSIEPAQPTGIIERVDSPIEAAETDTEPIILVRHDAPIAPFVTGEAMIIDEGHEHHEVYTSAGPTDTFPTPHPHHHEHDAFIVEVVDDRSDEITRKVRERVAATGQLPPTSEGPPPTEKPEDKPAESDGPPPGVVFNYRSDM
ncbi:MAG: hypothetical protein IT410_03420 [Candidatus Doudnabacteria bacterium]|nr:hypothetical protein [Candidatus Doudnabacteria bacterium]